MLLRRAACGALPLPLRRGSAGRGWYLQYKKHGEAAFRHKEPAAAFDWEAPEQELVKRARVFLHVEIDGQDAGRMVFELLNDRLPRTCENFENLCEGRGPHGYHYKGTAVHRVQRQQVLMAGDVTAKANDQRAGQGGHSSFEARYFEDEGFFVPHTERGLVSMASNGVDTNNSQFYVTFNRTPHLDGRCVAFGRLVQGHSVLDAIESAFCRMWKPVHPIVITDSGVLLDDDSREEQVKRAENDVDAGS